MNSFQQETNSFVAELSELSSSVQFEIVSGIPTLQIAKLFIYIYPANSRRQPVRPDFQTLHIDIDILQSSRQKVINRIKGMLALGERIYARDTVIARIDKKVALEFQEEHHIQMPLPGKYRYGLYYQGDLVSVCVFSGGRRMKDQAEDYRSFELLRFCHKGSLHVVGGISKLLDKFVAQFAPADIMTYADLDWCQQSSLERIGFVPVGVIPPQKFWVENGVRLYDRHYVPSTGYLVENSGSLKLKLIL